MRICTGDIIPSRGLSKNKSWHYGNKVRYLSKAIAQTGRSISVVHMHGVHVGRVRFPPARQVVFSGFFGYRNVSFCSYSNPQGGERWLPCRRALPELSRSRNLLLRRKKVLPDSGTSSSYVPVSCVRKSQKAAQPTTHCETWSSALTASTKNLKINIVDFKP